MAGFEKANPELSDHGRTLHLLWDLDSTLLDTYPAIDVALQGALAALEEDALWPDLRAGRGHAQQSICSVHALVT